MANGNWMNPLNKIRIRNAVNSEAPHVMLLDGRYIDIEYHQDGKRVWLKSRYDAAPCGWFEKRILNTNTWLTTDEKVGTTA